MYVIITNIFINILCITKIFIAIVILPLSKLNSADEEICVGYCNYYFSVPTAYGKLDLKDSSRINGFNVRLEEQYLIF